MVTNGHAIIDTANTTAAVTAEPIPVAMIDPSPLNRHCADADADIAALAQTIEENGLLYPISARLMESGRYELICGERRWRAFRLLERETIPCFVKNLDDTQAQIERIVENFQRRDPSFLEQGEAVAALMELTDRDISEVANRLGQSVAWVYRRAKLPNLIPAWRDELAKDDTQYAAIRDSVNKLEEIAVLPPATQQTLLESKALRYVKTTKEMRGIIGKLFMNLDAKPWSREWEKKTYSGSGKKRCDACMKRSDRENALFADPDDTNAGEKMCLDPECWRLKCLSWCKNLLDGDPGMIPIRDTYSYRTDKLTKFFGVKPVSLCDWRSRNEAEEREGYAALVGVFVDGANIGTTKAVWIQQPDEDNAEDGNVSTIHDWQRSNTNRHRERHALAELIAADVAAYLADIGTNALIPAAEFAASQLRAAVWFGISGCIDSENTADFLNPDWNPLAWTWEQTAEHIAEHIAEVTANDIADFEPSDEYKASVTILAGMFAIPVDMIAMRAMDTLYAATREEKGADSQDDAGNSGTDTADDTNDTAAEDFPEPADPVVPVDVEAMTDPEDTLPVTYLHILANAQ